VRESSPIELAGSVTKSRIYFRHVRWKGRRRCPRCGYRLLYHLKDRRFGCKRCRYKFGELTGTYIGEFYFSPDVLAHLLYLYALGVPAYRILVGKKHYIGILSDPSREPNIKGMEGIKSDRPEFINRVFRQLVDNIKNDIDPIPKLRQAFQHLNSRQVQVEQLAISLVLRKNQKSRRLYTDL
ncbi:MAG: transposase, partial [Nitrososphaeraceae archaeon]